MLFIKSGTVCLIAKCQQKCTLPHFERFDGGIFSYLQASGEAQEVLSLRQGPVRTLRLLKTPVAAFPDRVDIYANKRPLIALCDASR